MPGLAPQRSLIIHWAIEKNGEAEGTLRFAWYDGYSNGDESNYKLWRSTGGTPMIVPYVLNPSGNMVQTSGSESVMTGKWGVGEMAVAFTPVSISGSVLTSGGAGVRNAVVTISGGNLPAPVVFQTGQFGTYLFEGLQPGWAYTVRVAAKRFRFAQSSQIVTPQANAANLNFTANPQEEF
jgi:hypothetical protein